MSPWPVDAIGDDAIPLLTPGVRFTVLDGQVVLHDPSRGRTHLLNSSAALIWAEVDDRRTVRQIVDDLERQTRADRAVLDRDVKATLTQFVGLDIVQVDPGGEVDRSGEVAFGGEVAFAGASGAAGRGDDASSSRELDEVEWVATVGPVQALGVDLVVRTNHAGSVGLLRSALAALPTSPTSDPASTRVVVSLIDAGRGHPARYRVHVNDQRRWSDDEPTDLVAAALDEITRTVIDGTPGHLLLRAGAVERDGRVVVVAGDRGRGKSTLTAALVQRGARYLTDEVVAIDPATLAARPFPKALDLDERSRALLGLRRRRRRRPGADDRAPVAVEQLGAPSEGGQLALIVLLTDDVEPAETVEAPVPPAIRSVLDLIGVTFGPTFEDPTALDALAQVVDAVPVARLRLGTLADACHQIEAALHDLAPRPAGAATSTPTVDSR